MADRSGPDYELEETLSLTQAAQYRALFEDTRIRIVDLLLERAATISELAKTLDIPKGTVGHHVAVLLETGLIRLVRTKKVRAIEAKYYGRVARTYLLSSKAGKDIEFSPDYFLTAAAKEYSKATKSLTDEHRSIVSTLRYSRIPAARADEWVLRLGELAEEFVSEERGGDTTYGLLLALFPTDRPHLPDSEERS